MKLLKLSKKLLKEIDKIKSSTPKVIDQARKVIVLCRSLLSAFKEEILKNGFQNQNNEIFFFKKIKQVPLSQLIYHKEVYSLEVQIPKGDMDEQIIFIKKRLAHYNDFFMQNIDFGQYIESNNNDLDSYYFTRQKDEKYPIATPSCQYLIDPEFNTPKDMMLAQFMALRLANQYATSKLKNLSFSNMKPLSKKNIDLQCAASKTDLVELIYALIASGSIQGDIKELTKAFELIFNINGQSYGYVQSASTNSIYSVSINDNTLSSELLSESSALDVNTFAPFSSDVHTVNGRKIVGSNGIYSIFNLKSGAFKQALTLNDPEDTFISQEFNNRSVFNLVNFNQTTIIK